MHLPFRPTLVDFAISLLMTSKIDLLLCSAVTFRRGLGMKCYAEVLAGFSQGWLRDSLKPRQNIFPYRLSSPSDSVKW